MLGQFDVPETKPSHLSIIFPGNPSVVVLSFHRVGPVVDNSNLVSMMSAILGLQRLDSYTMLSRSHTKSFTLWPRDPCPAVF